MGGDADGLRKAREARARQLERMRSAAGKETEGGGDEVSGAKDEFLEDLLEAVEPTLRPFSPGAAMAAAQAAAEHARSLTHGSQAEFDAERAAPKGRARGRGLPTLERVVQAKVSEEEYDAMEEAALEAGMTLSAWARKVLKGGLAK